MADEIASLKVLITGDASQLEHTIQNVEAELEQLSKTGTNHAKKDTAATKTNTQEKTRNAQAVKESANTAVRESSSKGENTRSTLQNTTATEKNTSAKKKNKKETQESTKSLQETGKAWKDAGESIDTLTKPLQTTAVALAAGGVAAAKFAMDYETAFTGVKKTVDGTDEELNQLSDDIRQMALEIPVSAEELANLAAIGGQLGVKTKDITKFTEVVAAMGVSTNLAGESAASALARIVNVTGESMDNVDRIGSAIVALGNNSATTEAEIAEMAQRMGKFGNTVGINSHQVLAYSAALSSMGVEAQAGGSALGRVWMDIETAVTEGGSALVAYAKYAGKSAAEFKKQWSTDASGAFSGLIKGLSEAENLTAAIGEIGVNNTIDVQSVMALANNYELLASSLEISGEAYEENNALTKEAEAAYATTANQIQLMKNNLVEAGISFGEVLLPTVVNLTDGIKGFAQWLANLDEGTKENIVTIGKWVIGLGVFSKAVAGGAKFAGGFLESVGKIKAAFGAGDGLKSGAGILAKYAPALKGVISFAPHAAAGIAAVGAAVYVGKKAYDAWYDSQYRFTEDLKEGNQVIKENIEQIDDLKAAQQKIDAVKLIIENPKSSQEEIDSAEEQLQSIADMLEKKYGLHIDVEAPDLPKVAETVETVVQYKTGEEWNKARMEVNSQVEELGDDKAHIETQSPQMEQWRKDVEAARTTINELTAVKVQLDDLQYDLESGVIDQETYRAKVEEVGRAQLGLTEGVVTAEQVFASLNEQMSNQNHVIDEYDQKIKDYDASVADFAGATKTTADQIVSMIGSAEAAGKTNEIPTLLERLNTVLELGGLNAAQYAKTITDSLNGMDLSTAVQNGGDDLIQWLDSYANTAQQLGLSNEEMLLSIAQVATGFTDVESASQNMPTVLATLQKFASLSGLNLTAEQLTETAQAIGLIPENKQITIRTDGTYAISEVESTVLEAEGNTIELKADANTEPAEEKIEELNGKVITLHANVNLPTFPAAKGTDNFPGGLAMINDERGVSDPRELVEVDGKRYLFEGRDVVLPLPEHAKVYTASQTKQMMQGVGIPHYASGKNNTPWENDKSNWTHYSKTSLVSISAEEYLAWIEKMRVKYAENIDAMKELDEMWAEATKDSWDEWQENLKYALDMGEISSKEFYDKLKAYLEEYVAEGTDAYKEISKTLRDLRIEALETANDVSDAWLDTRLALNDWDDIADSAGAAFGRIRDRNLEAAEQGLISWEKYFKVMDDSFRDFATGRDEYSASWIKTQKDYYGMSAEEEYAAHQRRMNNLNEFVASCGELTDAQWATYVEVKAEIEQASWDAAARKVEEWRDDASFYKQQSEVFGWDWLNPDDSELQYWERVLKEENEYAKNLELSINDRQVAARKADEARLEIYKAKTAELDEAMQKYQDEIDAMREQLDDKVQKLRDSWTVEDRQKDMTELEKQLEIYKGAVTEEGRNQYESLLDEYTQLQREEQIYQLESENDATIGAMEEEYARMEAESKEILGALRDELTAGYTTQAQEISAVNSLVGNATNIANKIAADTKGYVESLQTEQLPNLQAALDSIAGLVAQIQAAQKEPDINYSQTNYFTVADNVDTSAAASKILRQFQSKYGGR